MIPVYKVTQEGSGWIMGKGSLIKLPNGKDAVLFEWYLSGRAPSGQRWQITELVNEWYTTVDTAIERHEQAMLSRHKVELDSLRMVAKC